MSTEKKNILWFTINRLSRLFINFWTGLEVPDVQRAIILLNEPPKWHNQTFRSSVVISPRAFVSSTALTLTLAVLRQASETLVSFFSLPSRVFRLIIYTHISTLPCAMYATPLKPSWISSPLKYLVKNTKHEAFQCIFVTSLLQTTPFSVPETNFRTK